MATESFEVLILRRRREEKMAQQKAREIQQLTLKIKSGATPTSKSGREAQQRRIRELRGHGVYRSKQRNSRNDRPEAGGGGAGEPIEFYVWNNGVMGKMSLSMLEPFETLEE